MRLHAKIGTMPATYIYVRTRAAPVVGERVAFKREQPGRRGVLRYLRWEWGFVAAVEDWGDHLFYRVERF